MSNGNGDGQTIGDILDEEIAGVSEEGGGGAGLTDVERDLIDTWNSSRPQGIGAISQSEAQRAKVYMDLYGVNFIDSLTLFAAWQNDPQGSGVIAPSLAKTMAATFKLLGPLAPQISPPESVSFRTAAGTSSVFNITSHLTRTTQRRDFEFGTRQATTARDVTQRTREFVDVPTPEEFLDDFQIGLARHVQDLVQTGELSRNAAQWVLDNPEFFLDDYLAELAARAERGEQVFRPVGAEGEITRVGERPGAATTTEEEERTRRQEDIQREISEKTQQAETVAGTGAATGTQTGTIDETTRQQDVSRLLETQRGQERFEQTEEIFSRPRLTTVAAVSPLDFLREKFGAGSLELTFAGFRGQRAAQERTSRGPPSIQPRRVR